jgi:hypothetical protein
MTLSSNRLLRFGLLILAVAILVYGIVYVLREFLSPAIG